MTEKLKTLKEERVKRIKETIKYNRACIRDFQARRRVDLYEIREHKRRIWKLKEELEALE